MIKYMNTNKITSQIIMEIMLAPVPTEASDDNNNEPILFSS